MLLQNPRENWCTRVIVCIDVRVCYFSVCILGEPLTCHNPLPFVQGKFTHAESLYGRSQAMREKVLGPEHPDVAKALKLRARSLQSQVRAVRNLQDFFCGVQ